MEEPDALNTIPKSILNRKGAIKTSLVPAAVRELLDVGAIESVNLCEWLVVDHSRLAQTVFPEILCEQLLVFAEKELQSLDTPTAMKRTRCIGRLLAEFRSSRSDFLATVEALKGHTSDTVRGWACMMIGHRDSATLAERLQWMDSFAADRNMGVREMAWLALRPVISRDIQSAIRLLQPWAMDCRDRIRRYASESTRPRGVWCSHLEELKLDPSPGLVLLEPLRADSSKYVRDSVANWLNDASRSAPEFVIETCSRWQRESVCSETQMIVRRSLRTLKKAGDSAANALLKKT